MLDLGVITVPTEVVSMAGASLMALAGWQVKTTIDLRTEVAELKTEIKNILAQCKLCNPPS